MKSLLEGLPPEIAKRIHPDWQKNEAEYWVQRNKLLSQYGDQWIGFANGRVIVSGTSPVGVFHAAQASGQHLFVTCNWGQAFHSVQSSCGNVRSFVGDLRFS